MAKLTAERARAVLDYDPGTGVLTWKRRPEREFKRRRLWLTWNTNWAGKEAGTISSLGYRYVYIDGQNYPAHRICWLLHEGRWPANQIDHINGKRADNRWGNFRDVAHGTNVKNARRRKDNKSGVTGVHWVAERGKWAAAIHVDGVDIKLGRFDDFDEAAKVRLEAQHRFGFHPNHGQEATV